MRRHPKLTTTAVNAGGALIAFSNEISQIWSDFTTGVYQTNPQQGLANLALKAVGVNIATGQVDTGKLTASLAAKAGGYVFVKIGKFFLRRIRF
jgi:hypothetical protein